MATNLIDWQLLGTTAAKIGFTYALTLPMGWLREKEGHAVGIRTFPIVAMASCGYMLVFQGVPGIEGQTLTSHILQGLVAGIGFIRGGAIMKDGLSVRGTATAASIWNTGAIGASLAMARYEVAIVLAFMNLVTLLALMPLKKRPDGPEI